MMDDHDKVYKLFSYIVEGKKDRFQRNYLKNKLIIEVFCYCRRPINFITSKWIVPQNCNRAISDIFNSCLIPKHFASNIGVAKSKVREKELVVWEILQEVMQGASNIVA